MCPKWSSGLVKGNIEKFYKPKLRSGPIKGHINKIYKPIEVQIRKKVT